MPGGRCESTPVDASCVSEVVLPLDMFAWLSSTNRHMFMMHTGARVEGVASWWSALRSSTEGRTFWTKHPYLRGRTPEELKYHLPLVLHEDAVPIANNHSAFVRSWSSVLGCGKETESRYVICTHIKDNAVAEHGEDKSWPVILSSFQDLALQQTSVDQWGGVLLFAVGDMEWVANVLGLPHYNAVECCAYCRATLRGDVPHNDYSRGAAWRATIRSDDGFRAALRTPLHPLVASEFFNRETYRLDLLHLFDHHGVAGHVIANIIAMHVIDKAHVVPGSSQEQRLAFVNEDIKGFYSTQHVPHRMPPIKMSNLLLRGFPELHGPAIKAANTKALVPFVLDLQRRAVAQDPSMLNRQAYKVVQSLARAYEIMYNAEFFLTAAEAQDLDEQLSRMGRSYQWLSVETMGQWLTRWKQPPKIHYAIGHLAQQARLINPRYVQCYSAEGLVGKVAKVWEKSMSGPHAAISQHMVLKKYLCGMHLDFSVV